MLKGDPGVCQYQNQFENDVWYVENVSFGTDVKLVVLLFKMTFNFKSRSKASKGEGYFVGYDDKGHATSVNRFKLDYPDAFEHLMDN